MPEVTRNGSFEASVPGKPADGTPVEKQPGPPPDPNTITPLPPAKQPKQQPPPKKKTNPKTTPPPFANAPASLHALPMFRGRSDDNSNSQFAMMALWVARRHDVPMERTLAFLEKRFRTSQNPNGSWGYTSGNQPGNEKNATRPDTMTCAGLLALALGHGVLQELQARSAAAGRPVPAVGNIQDQGILKGIDYVSGHVLVVDGGWMGR